ncbi:DUF6498-containing protein [Wenzhouxiangella sediminis]|uniref:Uncharacterized protein n=1 Tax=Wenzhouxiangella sediminis TaxID=1792836 RepID=A0A3E1K4V4_9GAMM|nr:DUF6498-containing protein [Wenzhouxiangella sediminis]RFF28916.1 hypothetical protein DZC52_15155 [Wenzhouxiangella sediminis]
MNETTRERSTDIGSLLGANGLTIVFAVVFGWSAGIVLWAYFAQNLIIGYFSRKRILALDEFKTDGFKINDRQPPPTPETKKKTANFFAFHFGFFHLGYFAFLAQAHRPDGLDLLLLAGVAVSFWFNHAASFRRHIEADAKGKTNIGTLMFLPYLRVVPMHLAVIIGSGAELMDTLPGLVGFMLLKTGADWLMHHVEHRILQRAGESGVSENQNL